MGDIKFSVIIPHYNIPELLERLLFTAPYDKEDAEIIVVDDRSDKNLEKLLEVKHRFGNMGVKFYRNNHGKKGAGTCRNIGMRHAAGKWLIFADADDRFKPGIYDILKRYEANDADIIFFKTESINEEGDRVQGRDAGYCKKTDDYRANPGRRNELLLRYDMPVPWGKMYRKEMIDKYRIFFPDMIVSEDAVFNCKCGHYAGKVEALVEVLYEVTEREGSLSSDFSTYKFRLQVTAFAQICRYIKQNESKEDWELLGFNGNLKMIEAYKRFGPAWMFYVFFVFAFNGVEPVSFKGMSIKTAPETLKRILEDRGK
ncbi:MAG: glycosyltransferase family 2 protein [Lachnospiraceae bacterium]|nr:glycosyltransferase family 2 protein [Lachnospiraceae bacterium]